MTTTYPDDFDDFDDYYDGNFRDVGGVMDGFGNVWSDADPGL
ncbi:hypothetical protein [Nonomuraea turkmeniaca]|nr:hypothetical protein [Nonomuraea turkmeniaca]